MYLAIPLTTKIHSFKKEKFRIMNELGEVKYYFDIGHHELTMDNIKKHASIAMVKEFKSDMLEFIPLDDYSPNLLILFRVNNTLKKYVLFKTIH